MSTNLSPRLRSEAEAGLLKVFTLVTESEGRYGFDWGLKIFKELVVTSWKFYLGNSERDYAG